MKSIDQVWLSASGSASGSVIPPLSDGQGEPSDVPVEIERFTKLGPLGFEPRTKGL